MDEDASTQADFPPRGRKWSSDENVHTRWAYKAVAVWFGIPALVGIVAYVVLLVNANQLIAGIALWVGLSPAMVFVFVSLMKLGAAATYKPVVNRESILWSWLNFVSRGSGGILLLVSGSILGALLGSLVTSPTSNLSALFVFVAVVVVLWLAVVVAIWTVRAAVDVFGLEETREDLIRQRQTDRGVRNVERKAALFALGSDFPAVIFAGFVMWALLTVALVGVLDSIGP